MRAFLCASEMPVYLRGGIRVATLNGWRRTFSREALPRAWVPLREVRSMASAQVPHRPAACARTSRPRSRPLAMRLLRARRSFRYRAASAVPNRADCPTENAGVSSWPPTSSRHHAESRRIRPSEDRYRQPRPCADSISGPRHARRGCGRVGTRPLAWKAMTQRAYA